MKLPKSVEPVERVTVDPKIRDGRPCVRGTGFTVSQLLAEVSEHDSIKAVADDFGLNYNDCVKAIEWAAVFFDE